MDFRVKNNYSPTVQEIAVFYGFSVKAAFDHINALKKKGYIRMTGRAHRSIEIVKNPQNAAPSSLPLAPGSFLMAPLINGGPGDGAWVYAHSSWIKFPDKNYFAMIVKDDSMTGAGIMPEDTALFVKQDFAGNGEIVAAETNDGYTLKSYYKENARVRLQPENPCYKAVYYSEINIIGALACVYRLY
jgi:repressor LexA